MILTPTTDLTPFAGARVTVNHSRTARIDRIYHGGEATSESLRPVLSNGVAGSYVEDPHGDCRGGSAAFWWPYGTDLSLEAS